MDNFGGQGLGHCCFTHACLADDYRIILGTAAQNLDYALHLHLTADNRVYAPMLSLIIKITSVSLQNLQHIILFVQGSLLLTASRHGFTPLVQSANHVADQSAVNTKLSQYPMSNPISCGQKAPQ